MLVRLTLLFALAFGLAALEAAADHHETGGPPGLEKKMKGEAERVRGKAKQAEKDWKKARESRGRGEDSDSESDAASTDVASDAESDADTRSDDSGAQSDSESSDSGTDADRLPKDKSNAARERLSKEEREQLRDEEGPGAWGRIRRFFGFDRAAERRSEQGAANERASEQDRGPDGR